MTDQFTVRMATAADSSTLAQQRAAMFRDMGVLPQSLDAPLMEASHRYFEEAIPSGQYLGWVVSIAGSRDVIAGAGLQLRRALPHPDPAEARSWWVCRAWCSTCTPSRPGAAADSLR